MVTRHAYTPEQKAWLRGNFERFRSSADLHQAFFAEFGMAVGQRTLSNYCNTSLGLKHPTLWTEQRVQWLRENLEGHTYDELASMFTRTYGIKVTMNGVKGICKKHGISHGTEDIPFTAAQDAWLKKHVSGSTWKEASTRFAAEFGVSKSAFALKARCRRLGITINNGKTGWHPGCPVANEQPEGAESKLASGYTYVKRDGKWVPKQQVVYESVHGPLSEGEMIVFLDKDKTNFELENLAIVTRAVHVRMCQNRWYSENQILTKTALSICKLDECIKDSVNYSGI